MVMKNKGKSMDVDGEGGGGSKTRTLHSRCIGECRGLKPLTTIYATML